MGVAPNALFPSKSSVMAFSIPAEVISRLSVSTAAGTLLAERNVVGSLGHPWTYSAMNAKHVEPSFRI